MNVALTVEPAAPAKRGYRGGRRPGDKGIEGKLVRYGTFEFTGAASYAQIAAELSKEKQITSEGVRILERRALVKLRKALEERGFVGPEG